MPESSTILRPFWSRLFNSLWAFGLVLIFVWGVPRFVIVLMANTTGDYRMVSIIFMSMWIAPWVFLSKHGRRSIGLVSPTNISWLFFGLILGAGLCAVMMMVATFLYDNSISNWFVYISNSYSNVPDNLTASDKQIYFIIYSIIGMLFSPIGEELFYRGIVHTSFI